MTRPPVEMADIVRSAGQSVFPRNQRKWITWLHLKVLTGDHVCCRTASLGGHVRPLFQMRTCAPSRTTRAVTATVRSARVTPADRWLEARDSGASAYTLRPTWSSRYRVPTFARSPCRTSSEIYDLLFHASAEDTARRSPVIPRHLGAEIGFFSILHTWNQRLQHHPHVHCVVPAGGLATDRSRWIASQPSFFLPTRVLRRVFRGKFVAGLKTSSASPGQTPVPWTTCPAVSTPSLRILASAAVPSRLGRVRQTAIRWAGSCSTLSRQLHHRVAISNHRLVALTNQDVTFRWRDSAHGNKKRRMTLPVDEFLRRFLLHLLPRGFVRIRHFGFLAN